MAMREIRNQFKNRWQTKTEKDNLKSDGKEAREEIIKESKGKQKQAYVTDGMMRCIHNREATKCFLIDNSSLTKFDSTCDSG